MTNPVQPLLLFALGCDWDGRIPRNSTSRWPNQMASIKSVLNARADIDDIAPILLEWSGDKRWSLLQNLGENLLCQYSPRQNRVLQHARFDSKNKMVINEPPEFTQGVAINELTIQSIQADTKHPRTIIGTGIERHHVRTDNSGADAYSNAAERTPFVNETMPLPALCVITSEPENIGPVYVHHRHNPRDSLQAIGGVEVLLFHLIRMTGPLRSLTDSQSTGSNFRKSPSYGNSQSDAAESAFNYDQSNGPDLTNCQSYHEKLTLKAMLEASAISLGMLPEHTHVHVNDTLVRRKCVQTAVLQLLLMATTSHVANTVAMRSCNG
ncbi:hypothetical protein SARC_10464 [Sphaeroforma arctica JP610]|uniref:Uncharacterized protein n=1 Tax=Sphaeroforma arctica JP610 TaxID=667725 RepID=A0A0L0FJX7_9EUKA|nr:hypothetical protein SARC_10464 [Sphaeroforma arctica JP610]KNC77067.1 hypothetical protein SARC_10464 [Sphaeroforma arctica JP610]|eukprot:XP_014150969.1 hypothetical protein SARC_10464 [Sphaeroforma arctica JP610]